MNPEHSIYDAIHEAHAIALTPTRGEHEVNEPDPYCWGDDPCVCVQLKAAREDERDNCWSAVAELTPTEFWANVPGLRDEWWIVKADALAAIDALKVKP